MDIRARVFELSDAGMSAAAIARELGLARNTVAYHLSRANRAGPDSGTPPTRLERACPPDAAGSIVGTRERVRTMLAQGHSRAAIASALGVSKATVTYHARRLGAAIDERCARRYDWAAVQRHYDAGHTVRECIAAFGFSSASWFKAVKRGDIIARRAGVPDDEFYVNGAYRGRFNVKSRLVRDGLKPGRCEICGLSEWRGAPITLALHHVNGIRDDNRLGNLQLLCPNCHSQTENFAGRNRRPGVSPPGR
jgi:DNA-binding CsgD family transcriptional regulator